MRTPWTEGGKAKRLLDSVKFVALAIVASVRGPRRICLTDI
jgi:hypothetical protein